MYRRLESTSRDLLPSVSESSEIIQHTCEFDRPISIVVAMPGTEDEIREALCVREDTAGREREEMRAEGVALKLSLIHI